MEVSRIRALRGPNLWSRHTAIEAIVTCPEAERSLAPNHPIEQRLRRIFPEVGPIEGSRPGQAPSMAHALEKVTLALQAQAGCPVTFSRTTATEESGVYQVVVQYSEEAVGRLALELAEQLCKAAALMDIHQSTTSNLVRSLIKSGLLHSEKSCSDRRVVELYALPEGLKLLKKIPGPFAGVLPHALQRMDEVTLLQLERNLSALINRLEVDEQAAHTPIAMM
jgi:DNA-binding MarR family transcriptional regulator